MVQEFGAAFGKSIERIPKKNMDTLERYHWPGNIRELRNVVERGMILSNGSALVVDLPDQAVVTSSVELSFEEMERMHIISVLDSSGWRVRGKKGAAERLNLKPSTLESKMKKLGIKRTILTHEI
jgi:transcriptional regulator with GAF, ATPase, and Fis domain